MRHGKKFNHLGRKTAHRKAMLANMATSLIIHKRIKTTVAKAKALKLYVEPLITKSKNDTTHSRRVVFSYLKDKYAVTELFREVSTKIANRPGGYTRILRTGNRLGDNAEMCIIELVDYNENMLTVKETKVKSTRRRSKSKKKVDEAPKAATETSTEEVKVEEKAEKVEKAPAKKTAAKKEEKAPAKKAEKKVAEKKTEAKEEKKTEAKEEKKAEEKKPKSEKKTTKKEDDSADEKKSEEETK
jgi:large subunit ribosomal protein L17